MHTYSYPLKEVRLLAAQLGMDLEVDKQFVWFLKQALITILPMGWRKEQDNLGATQYHNTMTGVTTETHPLVYLFRASYSRLLEMTYVQYTTTVLPKDDKQQSRRQSGLAPTELVALQNNEEQQVFFQDLLKKIEKKQEGLKDSAKFERMMKEVELFYNSLITAAQVPKSIADTIEYQCVDPKKVLEAAKALGIQDDYRLFWLARLFSVLPLPPLWKRSLDSFRSEVFVNAQYNVTLKYHPSKNFFYKFIQKLRFDGIPPANSVMEFLDKKLRSYDVDLHRLIAGENYVIRISDEPVQQFTRKLKLFQPRSDHADTLDDMMALELAGAAGIEIYREPHLFGVVYHYAELMKIKSKEKGWEFRYTLEGQKYWYHPATQRATKRFPFKSHLKSIIDSARIKYFNLVTDYIKDKSEMHPSFRNVKKELPGELRQLASQLMAVHLNSYITGGKVQLQDASPFVKKLPFRPTTKQELDEVMFCCPFRIKDENDVQQNDFSEFEISTDEEEVDVVELEDGKDPGEEMRRSEGKFGVLANLIKPKALLGLLAKPRKSELSRVPGNRTELQTIPNIEKSNTLSRDSISGKGSISVSQRPMQSLSVKEIDELVTERALDAVISLRDLLRKKENEGEDATGTHLERGMGDVPGPLIQSPDIGSHIFSPKGRYQVHVSEENQDRVVDESYNRQFHTLESIPGEPQTRPKKIDPQLSPMENRIRSLSHAEVGNSQFQSTSDETKPNFFPIPQGLKLSTGLTYEGKNKETELEKRASSANLSRNKEGGDDPGMNSRNGHKETSVTFNPLSLAMAAISGSMLRVAKANSPPGSVQTQLKSLLFQSIFQHRQETDPVSEEGSAEVQLDEKGVTSPKPLFSTKARAEGKGKSENLYNLLLGSIVKEGANDSLPPQQQSDFFHQTQDPSPVLFDSEESKSGSGKRRKSARREEMFPEREEGTLTGFPPSGTFTRRTMSSSDLTNLGYGQYVRSEINSTVASPNVPGSYAQTPVPGYRETMMHKELSNGKFFTLPESPIPTGSLQSSIRNLIQRGDRSPVPRLQSVTPHLSTSKSVNFLVKRSVERGGKTETTSRDTVEDFLPYYMRIIGSPFSIPNFYAFQPGPDLLPSHVVQMGLRLGINVSMKSFSSTESDLLWIAYLQLLAPVPPEFPSISLSSLVALPFRAHPGDSFFKLMLDHYRAVRNNELKDMSREDRISSMVEKSWLEFSNTKYQYRYRYNFLTGGNEPASSLAYVKFRKNSGTVESGGIPQVHKLQSHHRTTSSHELPIIREAKLDTGVKGRRMLSCIRTSRLILRS